MKFNKNECCFFVEICKQVLKFVCYKKINEKNKPTVQLESKFPILQKNLN